MKVLGRLGKMNKKNNKGFTLVELIVVIVILAILAAILVPALLGYIDRARGSGVLLSAKSFMTAAQAELSDAYGNAKTGDTVAGMMDATRLSTIKATADVQGSGSFTTGGATSATATPANHAAWTISEVWYTENNVVVHYVNGEWQNPAPAGTAWDAGEFDVK